MLGALFGPPVEEICLPEEKERYSGVAGLYGVRIDAPECGEGGGATAVSVRALVGEVWWGENSEFLAGADTYR
jgi:hypothetical protein